jgi:phosphoglycolate phosphatase-like HAD superfamily hydrolase
LRQERETIMVMEVKWCGIDFGQCIQNPGGLRNPLVFGDICKELGKPELIPEKIRRYRILKEKFGSYGRIKEGHRDEIYSFVLDNDPIAVKLFQEKEQEYLAMADGTEEALEYLSSQGIEIQVISEMKKTLGPIGTDFISTFLKRRGIARHIKDLVTPQGKINLEKSTVDPKYKGTSKKDGSLYDILIQDLKSSGIEPHEAVMVGDKPETDIDPAHDRGFKTIQYTGYIDLGESKADAVIASFHELITLLRKKR